MAGGRPRTTDATDAGPRVLVARPDHLGDLLLTLPAIRALRTRLPGARITFAVPPALVAVAERAVDVDEVLEMPFVLDDPPPSPESPAAALAAAPLRGRFDLAVLPRPGDPWSGALSAAASVPVRVGHRQPATTPFLTHAYPERPSRHVAREAVVLALRATALLRPGRRPAPLLPAGFLRLLPRDRGAAANVLRASGVREPPVVIHPTAGWPLKTWPLDRWVTLVSRLRERVRSPVVVVGQPADRSALEAIVRGRGDEVVAVDDLSIGALAALHACARLVVGMDSGALHLAALVGAPVVGLFGPFAPARVAPLAPPHRFRAVWWSLPCSPCGTLESPPCGATHEPACLRDVPAEAVLRAAAELVDRRG